MERASATPRWGGAAGGEELIAVPCGGCVPLQSEPRGDALGAQRSTGERRSVREGKGRSFQALAPFGSSPGGTATPPPGTGCRWLCDSAAEQPAFQGYRIWGGSGSCLPTDGFARFCLWIQHKDDKERGVLVSLIPGHFH